MVSLSCEERDQLSCHVSRPGRCAERLLIDDELAATPTSAISEQEVFEAISRLPRREFDEAIRRRNETTSGLVIGHELDAVGELFVGIAQRDYVDGTPSAAVFQARL